jgi:CRISPR/Cas system-associated protein endoribonuclease Cas2
MTERREYMERKIISKQTVTTLPTYENSVLVNWINHYTTNNNYGKGVGSSYEKIEDVKGNYGMMCTICHHINEVELSTKLTSNISMKNNNDNFYNAEAKYSGKCPNCNNFTTFQAIPVLFANPLVLLTNKKYIVGFTNLYDKVKSKIIYFTLIVSDKEYKFVREYIRKTFIYDLPLTWVFDHKSYKEFKEPRRLMNPNYHYIQFQIYTDAANLAEAILDLEEFVKELCPLNEIYKNKEIRKDQWVIMKDIINLLLEPKWM